MVYYIGSDRNASSSTSDLAAVCSAVQAGGKQVQNLGVNSSILCSILESGKLTSSDFCVAMVSGLCLGTVTDYNQKNYSQNGCTIVYALCQWYGAITDGEADQQITRAHDDDFSPSSWNLNGTFSEFCSKYGNKFFYAKSVEECAQKILSGSFDGGAAGSNTQQQGTVSPLLSGEMTFQELIGEICEGIDILFLCKRNNVVVTDFETIYAEAMYARQHDKNSVSGEDIHLWQLEDDSYEFNVDQFGYYNTVVVKYNGGSVKESYDDLVRVFGEQKIEYKEEGLDSSTARMKAKAYLAAHVREFNMKIDATIIHDGGIDIGDIVTLNNPLTLRDSYKKVPEYLFVEGNSISWEGDSGITNDLELRYAPESPERKEIPTSGGGTTTGSGNLDSALAVVGPMTTNIAFCHSCQTHDCVVEKGCGDCWGMSDFIQVEMAKLGVTVKVVQYDSGYAEQHRSVLINRNGAWEDFPYKQYNCKWEFNATAGAATGQEIPASTTTTTNTTATTTAGTGTSTANTK